MSSTDALRKFRERRERLFKRTNPRARQFDFARDAWVLWAAYDLGSFPALRGAFKKPNELFDYFVKYASGKSQVLVMEADHKYFREKRGPVCLVSIDNYGWRVEPQFDFFFWASPRHRLASAVSFLHMTRYSKEVGVCVLRVAERDVEFCKHLYEYDLLRPYGEIPNAGPLGREYLFGLTGRKSEAKEERKAA